ncbi:MAG: acetate kinase [Firmicutes bacterium]|nr:acetate kinase [Bacillota bacterium]
MKVLVVNCGSSSLKYQVLDMPSEELLCKGLVERIGIEGSVIKHEKIGQDKFVLEVPMKDHTEAIGHVIDALLDADHGVAKSMDEIGAVGHRIVQGGEKFAKSELVTDEMIKAVEGLSELAPLHNPANLLGIAACKKLMPNTPMVGVFDTSFHQTMPAESYIYALPYELYEKYGVRRYGFHGTSHRYVTERAAAMLGKKPEEVNLVTCHIGNGASCAAVKNGKCFDTSMGLTPLEGLVMGTRCGDIDPAIIPFVAGKENMTFADIDTMMNKKSGIQGISGISSDMRDVEEAMNKGDKRAKIAWDVFAHRVKHYIGAYMAEIGGADAIVFTAGVGENSATMRADICAGLENLGIKIDAEKNKVRGEERDLSAAGSTVKVLLIPTNEELMIAKDTYEIVTK